MAEFGDLVKRRTRALDALKSARLELGDLVS
jgi:hypothetical protein